VSRLLLYTTLGCHLCEQAVAVANPLCEDLGLELVPVEIADSDELVDRYGIRIPVVRLEQTLAELGWPFNQYDLEEYLNANSPSG
jgi:hypothetical protein